MKKNFNYFLEKVQEADLEDLKKPEEEPESQEEEKEEGHGTDEDLGQKIFDFFVNKKGSIDDKKDIHSLAEKSGIDPHEFEEEIYTMIQSLFAGGKSKGKEPKGVDPEEVRMGLIVEAEHSSNKLIQLKIVWDHLTDNPKYYSEGKAKGIFDELK